jgi:geranylgeranyl diphosphate synthase type I
MTTQPMTTPRALGDSRRLVTPALRAAVDRLDPATAMQAAYHFGWIDAAGAPSDGGGKAVRPALALLGARAVGAEAEIAVPGAVAVELVHNFSLLHDDLMDGDTERRHRPTVWARWGPAAAILAGDALLGLAQEILLDVRGDGGAAAARLLARSTRDLIRGQVEDMSFEGRPEVPVERVLDMAEAKTAALLAASAAIGAVLAEADAAEIDALTAYGRHLGLAFQLVDDVLGIWGDPALTGKPVRSDLRARKTSLPVAWAIGQGGTAGAELTAWLRSADAPGEDRLVELADLLAEAGAAQWARSESARHAEAAAAALDLLTGPADAKDELREIGAFVVGRDL